LRGTHPVKNVHHPYPVLLDHNIPRISGEAFLRKLRSDVNWLALRRRVQRIAGDL